MFNISKLSKRGTFKVFGSGALMFLAMRTLISGCLDFGRVDGINEVCRDPMTYENVFETNGNHVTIDD